MNFVNIFPFCVEGVFFLVSVTGNSLVLFVMLRNSKFRKTPSKIYLISISLIDLITAIFAIPFSMSWVRWFNVEIVFIIYVFTFVIKMLSQYFEDNFELCILLTSGNAMLCITQLNLLITLSFDRYLAVCKPIKYFKQKNLGYQKFIVLACVFLGVAFGLPIKLGFNNAVPKTCYAIDILRHEYMLSCCIFSIVSFMVIMTHYILIYKSLSNQVSRNILDV